jgi:hypothetical protein
MDDDNGAMSADDFANSLKSDIAEQPEKDSEDSTEGDEVEENEEDDSSEEEEQPEQKADSAEFLELEEQGQKVKIPKAEALEAWKQRDNMNRDYTQKMQQLSEYRQSESRRLSAEAEFTAAVVDDISSFKQLSATEKQYEAINWQQLVQDDPQLYTQRLAELTELRQRKAGAEQLLNGKRQQFDAYRSQQRAALTQEIFSHIATSDKTFDSKRWQGMVANAVENGVSPALIDNMDDKGLVAYWNTLYKKASAFDELVKNKPMAQKQIQSAPTRVAQPKAQTTQRGEQMAKALSSRKMNARDFASMLSKT